jgi:hypothetical protein
MMLAAMTAYSATEKNLEPQITTQMEIKSGLAAHKSGSATHAGDLAAMPL